MPTKQVRRLLSVAAMAPLLLTSCDSNNPFDPFEDAVGTYELSLYADQSLPAIFDCGPGECGTVNGGRFVATDGTLVLREDGTFVETNHYTLTPTGGSPENSTFISNGTYDSSGDDLTLFAPAQNGIGPRTLYATFIYAGNDVKIRYVEDNDAYEYRR